MAPTKTPVDVPAAPPGLLASSRKAWVEFWGSRAATWVDRGSALPRLVRWIYDVDQYQRILADMRPGVREGLVEGTRLQMSSRGEVLEVDALIRDHDGVPGVFDGRRPWLGLGSTGQVSDHPHAKLLRELDDRIHRAEGEFGMTPLAAVRLAGAGVQGALTAEQLSQLVQRRGEAQPDEIDAPWAAGLVPVGS